jgi:hypothetical protein
MKPTIQRSDHSSSLAKSVEYALKATLTAKDRAQADAQNLSKTEHRTADELIAEITAGKLDIQLAADQEWPWKTCEFDIIRDQFHLPRTRPMKE